MFQSYTHHTIISFDFHSFKTTINTETCYIAKKMTNQAKENFLNIFLFINLWKKKWLQDNDDITSTPRKCQVTLLVCVFGMGGLILDLS